MLEFVTSRRVEFADTDLGGICHFSRYFVFMETAEHELLESLGTRVHTIHDGEPIGWPRVASSCEFHAPARFGDLLEIRVRVERRGRSSVTYAIEVSRDGVRLASGTTTAVCCVLKPDVAPRSIPIPPALAARLGGEE